MIKQVIALAFAAAFGIANAADTTSTGTSGTGATQSKGVGADKAVGEVPQTTLPAGTNAPDTAKKSAGDKKTHKTTHKKTHNKSKKSSADKTTQGVGADSAIGNTPQTTQPIGTNAPGSK